MGRIIEIDAIRMLVEHGVVVICAGGGGIPTAYDDEGRLYGVEAVIDKDLASSLLARDLSADMLVMLTDVSGVYASFNTPEQREIRAANPDEMDAITFAPGSMGPKVTAACQFARATGNRSAIGQLSDLGRILEQRAGTLISTAVSGIEYRD